MCKRDDTVNGCIDSIKNSITRLEIKGNILLQNKDNFDKQKSVDKVNVEIDFLQTVLNHYKNSIAKF